MQKLWVQILAPTESDKGKYTLEMSDGQETHKRSLDLSGQGQSALGTLVCLLCPPCWAGDAGSSYTTHT